MHIHSVTEKEDRGFSILEYRWLPISDPQQKMAIAIEMNKDVTVVTRKVYSSFMFFGELGGLHSLLISVTVIILSRLNDHNLQNSLVTDLYMSDDDILKNNQLSIRLCLQQCLPKFCKKLICLRRNKKDFFFAKARERL